MAPKIDTIRRHPGYHDLEPRQQLVIKTRQKHTRRYWDVYDKQSYECPCCGRGYGEVGERFDIHHKDQDPLNGHMYNLVALCYRCHKRVHRVVRIADRLEEWKDEGLSLGTPEEKVTPLYGLSVRGQTTLDDFTTEEVSV